MAHSFSLKKKPLDWVKRLAKLCLVASYLPAFAVGISTFPFYGGCCSVIGPFPQLLLIRVLIYRFNSQYNVWNKFVN